MLPCARGFLLREDKWAYIQYREDASDGIELFDTEQDPLQYKNLAQDPAYASLVASFQSKLADKLAEVRENDLGIGPHSKPRLNLAASTCWMRSCEPRRSQLSRQGGLWMSASCSTFDNMKLPSHQETLLYLK